MLGSIDYTGKKSAVYTCDRCQVTLDKKQRKGIYVTKEDTGIPIKKWDLCPRCYKALERGIEKGKNNNVSNICTSKEQGLDNS